MIDHTLRCDRFVPAIEKGKLVATISYPSSRPPPETVDEDLEIDCGFIGFTPLNTPQEPILADIVAVTGLASHAFGSWSSLPRQMWLRDFRPQDIPDIAIYTYGYESSYNMPRVEASYPTTHVASWTNLRT